MNNQTVLELNNRKLDSCINVIIETDKNVTIKS